MSDNFVLWNLRTVNEQSGNRLVSGDAIGDEWVDDPHEFERSWLLAESAAQQVVMMSSSISELSQVFALTMHL